MKILFLSDDFPPVSFGGAGIVAYNLAKAISDLGHDVYVITSTQDKNSEGHNIHDGLKIFTVYSKYHPRWRAYLSLYNPQTISRVSKIISEIKPDVIHAHNVHYYLSYHSLKLAKASGARVILTAHDAMLYSYGRVRDDSKRSPFYELKNFRFRYNPFRNIIIKYYLKSVDKVISISEALARALKNNGIKNIAVVYNGINVEDWAVTIDEIRDFKQHHGLNNKKVILFSGRISGSKGGENIVRAMGKVVKKIPESVLLVVGREDEYTKILKDVASGGSFLNSLVFIGWLGRKEIGVAYFSCDLVVVPSIYLDPFVLVNLEAMVAKKPVVGTCFGGTPEIIVDNETGYIVDPNDEDVLVEKIVDLLTNDKKAKEFGERGYKRVKESFSLERQVQKYLSHYSY